MRARHREFRRDTAGAAGAVLFIHGIVGSPSHFHDFYDLVPANWSVRSILMDGHGGTVREFSRSSMVRWKQQVSQIVDELVTHHPSVMITGHSMGTLLAIEQALRKPGPIKGLFLLAVPLKARVTRAAVTESIRTALDLDARGDPTLEAAKAAYSIDPDRKIWRYLGYIPRYHELMKLMRETRDSAQRLRIPCQVLMSRNDEIVSPRSAEWLTVNPLVELAWLEHSDHKFYAPQDRRILLDRFKKFCRELI